MDQCIGQELESRQIGAFDVVVYRASDHPYWRGEVATQGRVIDVFDCVSPQVAWAAIGRVVKERTDRAGWLCGCLAHRNGNGKV